MKKAFSILALLLFYLFSASLVSASSYFDEFTDSDGTILYAHNNVWDCDLPSQAIIKSNKAITTGPNYQNCLANSLKNGSTSSIVNFPNSLSQTSSAVFLRYIDSNNYYQCNLNAGDGYVIFKKYRGSFSVIKNVSGVPGAGIHTIQCSISDSTIILTVDGIERVKVTDTDLQNSGRNGIQVTPNVTIDNYNSIDEDINPIPTSTPIPTLTPTPTPRIPLIFIPGVGGSELKSDQTFTSKIKECGIAPILNYNINEIVWINTLIAGFSPCDDYFDVIKLKKDGQTSEYPQIVINGTITENVYKDFINFFTDNGYELNKTLFLFPYDWRKDIFSSAPLLDQKINEIKLQTGNQKVDIIAHSMGGLVARNYILEVSKAQNIRKLFTLGTPYLGSVKMLKTLQYGDSFGPTFLFNLINFNPNEIKDIVQNFISSYQLIPTKKYFDFYSGEDNLHPFPFRDNLDIDRNNVVGALNYDQIKNLLANFGRNTSLLKSAEKFHLLNDNLIDTNGVEVVNIVGSGIPTLGQIIEKYSIDSLGNKSKQKDEISINGDKTVPLFSASMNDPDKNMSFLGITKIFYTKQEHGDLVSFGPALNLIKNLLNNDSRIPDGISNYPYHFTGIKISTHSPINIHAYDHTNRHTGLIGGENFEENIPGSFYDTLDSAKFIWLPNDKHSEYYNIKLEATNNGSFDFKIRIYENDINIITFLYNNINLTNTTKAQTTIYTSSTEPPILQIDQDGNGSIDKNVNPTFMLNRDDVYDVNAPEAKIFIDQDKRALAIVGVDVNPTMVTRFNNILTKKGNDFFYLINDTAENSLKIDIRQIEKNKQDIFEIYSIQYNNGPIQALDSNRLNIIYDKKKNKINVNEQFFETNEKVKMHIKYDPRENKSIITTYEPGWKKVKEIINGLAILELTTKDGHLEASYKSLSL